MPTFGLAFSTRTKITVTRATISYLFLLSSGFHAWSHLWVSCFIRIKIMHDQILLEEKTLSMKTLRIWAWESIGLGANEKERKWQSSHEQVWRWFLRDSSYLSHTCSYQNTAISSSLLITAVFWEFLWRCYTVVSGELLSLVNRVTLGTGAITLSLFPFDLSSCSNPLVLVIQWNVQQEV